MFTPSIKGAQNICYSMLLSHVQSLRLNLSPLWSLMTLLWLATLILASGFAFAGAEGLKAKVLNLLITFACMSLGYGIGYAAGLGSKNLGRVPHAALPISMMFGIAAALGCVWLNTTRDK